MAAFYDFVLYIVALIVPSLVAIVAVVVHKLGIIDAWFFNLTEEEKKRNGGDLVAAILKEHGVKFVFTLCGGHISPILVGCEKLGIRVVDTRHEATTVFAADAVSRLSGVIGVAAVTAGPGVTNTVTAVKNAQMAQSPVLLLGGAAPTLLQGRGALQDIDQLSIFKPLCKYCASVRRVTAAADILSKAKKPVLLIGSQTLLPPQPADRIQQAVESLGVPCFLAGMARGLLGKNSKLHIRQRRRDALKEADVVILAGTVCDFRLGYGRLLSRKSKIIAVNRDYDQLTKLPVISVIGNDAAWTQILREQLPMLGSNVGCVLAHCEYEKVADGFGGVGFSLQDGDENDIRRVLESAVAATKEGKPSLINAWIGKSDFRDGSISM